MNKKISHSSHHDRGSVMVLVVAVLGLLVVIGTVYIVASRTDRNSAAASSATINLNLARQAVMANVQQSIGNAMVDANGQIGQYATSGTYGTQAARNFDYPDAGSTFGKETNNNVRDEPWLVVHMHPQATASIRTAGPNDFSYLTAAPFNPLTGAYDLPGGFATTNTCNVVNDRTPASQDATTDDPPKYTSFPTPIDDAFINLLPFSEATGIRYRFGIRIIDTNRMANLNTGSADDAKALADTTGTYLTSMRLATASGVLPAINAYFNASNSGTGDGYTNNDGITKIALNIHASSTKAGVNIGLGRVGLSTLNTNANFSPASWQSQILRFEKPNDPAFTLYDSTEELELRSYGEYGTSYHLRFALGVNPLTANGSTAYWGWPATLSCAANAAGAFSPSGGSVIGNARRRNYTTYSFSRDIRPFPNPVGANLPFTLTYAAGIYAGAGGPFSAPTNFPTDFAATSQTPGPGYAAVIYPSSPSGASTALPKIPINPLITSDSATPAQTLASPSKTNWDSMYFLAMTATNIATAMERTSGYSHAEACSFAANYISSLWSGLVKDPGITVAGVTAYYLPDGPTFIDTTGICVRTAVTVGALPTPIGANFGTTGGTDLNTSPTSTGPGNIYLAYAAQPFINQIAAQSTSAMMTVTVNDSAIELYNPYLIALSMNGYHLTDPTTGMNLNLQVDDNGQKLYIPAGGFLIITNGGGTPALAPSPSPNTVVAKYVALALAPTGSNTVSLVRPIVDRTGATILVTVDQAGYLPVDTLNSIFVPSTVDAPATNIAIKRGDPTNALSIVGPNTPPIFSTAATPIFPLNDRSANTVTAINPLPLANIGDFDKIMRIGHVVTPAGASVPVGTNGDGLLTRRIGALGTAPDSLVPGPDNLTPAGKEGKEAILYFDFYPNAKMFANTAQYPFAPLPPIAPDTASDLRAIYLLEHLTCIDRYSDNTIDIGGGSRDINKLRIAGKINVNTASGDVLRSIPGIQLAAASPAQSNTMVANILGYRARLAAGGASYNAQPSTVDYSSQANYPGYGIRTLSELLIPISVPGSVTIDKRGAIWASIFNLCTVRSDTFVVYGYLEAVRQNPSDLTFNNSSDWYTPSIGTTYNLTTNIIDDPHNTGPLLRVARRRWVAIIDRSFSNYSAGSSNFSLPKIVAIKDLSQ